MSTMAGNVSGNYSGTFSGNDSQVVSFFDN